VNSPAVCDGQFAAAGHAVLRLALPNLGSPDPGELGPAENAAAVDKLFGLMLEWFAEVEQSA